jgi:hypothetical protein
VGEDVVHADLLVRSLREGSVENIPDSGLRNLAAFGSARKSGRDGVIDELAIPAAQIDTH